VIPENDDAILAWVRAAQGEGPEPLPELAKLTREAEVTPLSPEELRLIALLARAHDAKRVLEIGTALGNATAWLLGSLPDDATVDTIEIDEPRAEAARKNLETLGFAGRANVIADDARHAVPGLAGTYDFVLLDADPMIYPGIFQFLAPKMRPGALLVVAHVFAKGAAPKGANAAGLGARAFLDQLTRSRKFASAVLMAGDGLALARREDA